MLYQARREMIEAFQMTEEHERGYINWPEWLKAAYRIDIGEEGSLYCHRHQYSESNHSDQMQRHIHLVSQGRTFVVYWNNWIVRTEDGDLKVYTPDIFEKLYEPRGNIP